MKSRQLGRSSLTVSELGFGCWGIGGDSYGKTDDRVSAAALRTALELGFTLYDTADIYGGGHSESLLGETLRDAGMLDSVVIATKGGGAEVYSGLRDKDLAAAITSAAEASLRRLTRDYIDLYQLHDPPLDVLRRDGTFEALESLKKRGLVRCVGVSVSTLAEVRAAVAHDQVSSVQITYNMLSLINSEMSIEHLEPLLRARGVGVLGREPLANGYLSGKHNIDTHYGEADRRGLWPENLRTLRIRAADSLCSLQRPGMTLAQIALRFALDQNLCASVLVGMKSTDQVIENHKATELPSFEEIAAAFE